MLFCWYFKLLSISCFSFAVVKFLYDIRSIAFPLLLRSSAFQIPLDGCSKYSVDFNSRFFEFQICRYFYLHFQSVIFKIKIQNFDTWHAGTASSGYDLEVLAWQYFGPINIYVNKRFVTIFEQINHSDEAPILAWSAAHPHPHLIYHTSPLASGHFHLNSNTSPSSPDQQHIPIIQVPKSIFSWTATRPHPRLQHIPILAGVSCWRNMVEQPERLSQWSNSTRTVLPKTQKHFTTHHTTGTFIMVIHSAGCCLSNLLWFINKSAAAWCERALNRDRK